MPEQISLIDINRRTFLQILRTAAAAHAAPEERFHVGIRLPSINELSISSLTARRRPIPPAPRDQPLIVVNALSRPVNADFTFRGFLPYLVSLSEFSSVSEAMVNGMDRSISDHHGVPRFAYIIGEYEPHGTPSLGLARLYNAAENQQNGAVIFNFDLDEECSFHRWPLEEFHRSPKRVTKFVDECPYPSLSGSVRISL
jgi:hypothetical protein